MSAPVPVPSAAAAQATLLATAAALSPTHPAQAQALWRIAVGLTPHPDPQPALAQGDTELQAQAMAVSGAFVAVGCGLPEARRLPAMMIAGTSVVDLVLGCMDGLPACRDAFAAGVALALARHGAAEIVAPRSGGDVAPHPAQDLGTLH